MDNEKKTQPSGNAGKVDISAFLAQADKMGLWVSGQCLLAEKAIREGVKNGKPWKLFQLSFVDVRGNKHTINCQTEEQYNAFEDKNIYVFKNVPLVQDRYNPGFNYEGEGIEKL